MFNSIIADFIGSAYEGGDLKGTRLPFITKASSFTDDSVMLGATMSVLLDATSQDEGLPSLTPRKFARAYKDWGRKYSDSGFSPQFKEWLRKDSLSPGHSVGSLAPVRATPIAWATDSENEALALAEMSAKATHDTTEAMNASKAVVHAIFRLRQGDSPEQVSSFIQGLYFVRIEHDWDEENESGGFTSHAEDCAGLGIGIGLTATSIESAIRLCLYVGGDTDTIGAIAAAVIEARFPGGDMPAITEKVKARMTEGKGQAILDVVDQFKSVFMEPCNA